MIDYIANIYNETERPKTAYPGKLAEYLTRYAELKPGMTLLEIGCGRCEFLHGFADCGLNVTGVDISPKAGEYAPEFNIHIANIEKETLPFPDCSFDVVYSKSLIEHLWEPEKYFHEAWRVLTFGGTLLTLVPDWESCYKIYFDDYTHRTPFSKVTLSNLYRMCGFSDIFVKRFRQLPITWKYPWINIISGMIAPFVPVRTQASFFRWSRELMVIGIGKKGKE